MCPLGLRACMCLLDTTDCYFSPKCVLWSFLCTCMCACLCVRERSLIAAFAALPPTWLWSIDGWHCLHRYGPLMAWTTRRYGIIPRVTGKGEAARQVADMLVRMQKEQQEPSLVAPEIVYRLTLLFTLPSSTPPIPLSPPPPPNTYIFVLTMLPKACPALHSSGFIPVFLLVRSLERLPCDVDLAHLPA